MPKIPTYESRVGLTTKAPAQQFNAESAGQGWRNLATAGKAIGKIGQTISDIDENIRRVNVQNELDEAGLDAQRTLYKIKEDALNDPDYSNIHKKYKERLINERQRIFSNIKEPEAHNRFLAQFDSQALRTEIELKNIQNKKIIDRKKGLLLEKIEDSKQAYYNTETDEERQAIYNGIIGDIDGNVKLGVIGSEQAVKYKQGLQQDLTKGMIENDIYSAPDLAVERLKSDYYKDVSPAERNKYLTQAEKAVKKQDNERKAELKEIQDKTFADLYLKARNGQTDLYEIETAFKEEHLRQPQFEELDKFLNNPNSVIAQTKPTIFNDLFVQALSVNAGDTAFLENLIGTHNENNLSLGDLELLKEINNLPDNRTKELLHAYGQSIPQVVNESYKPQIDDIQIDLNEIDENHLSGFLGGAENNQKAEISNNLLKKFYNRVIETNPEPEKIPEIFKNTIHDFIRQTNPEIRHLEIIPNMIYGAEKSEQINTLISESKPEYIYQNGSFQPNSQAGNYYTVYLPDKGINIGFTEKVSPDEAEDIIDEQVYDKLGFFGRLASGSEETAKGIAEYVLTYPSNFSGIIQEWGETRKDFEAGYEKTSEELYAMGQTGYMPNVRLVEKPNKKIVQFAKKVKEKNLNWYQETFPNLPLKSNHPFNKFMRNLGHGVGSFGEAMAWTVVTKNPQAAALMFATRQKSALYEEARESGKTPDESSRISSIGAVPEYLLEKWGVENIFRLKGKVLKSMLTEGVQEMSQTVAEEAVTVGSDVRSFTDREKDVLFDVLQSGAIGALTGGGGAVTINTMDAYLRKKGVDKVLKEKGIPADKIDGIIEDFSKELSEKVQKIAVDAINEQQEMKPFPQEANKGIAEPETITEPQEKEAKPSEPLVTQEEIDALLEATNVDTINKVDSVFNEKATQQYDDLIKEAINGRYNQTGFQQQERNAGKIKEDVLRPIIDRLQSENPRISAQRIERFANERYDARFQQIKSELNQPDKKKSNQAGYVDVGALTLNADVFVQKDIAPKLRGVTSSIKEIPQTFKTIFTPEKISEETFKVAKTIRKAGADRALAQEKFIKQNQQLWNFWSKIPEDQRLAFIEVMEFGEKTGVDELDGIADYYRKIFKETYEMSKSLDEKVAYIEDYFPHLWEDTKKAGNWIGMHKIKLGKERFSKSRTIDLISNGLKYGLRLKSTNPQDLVELRYESALLAKYKADILDSLEAHGIISEEKQDGLHGIDTPRGTYYADPDNARLVERKFKPSWLQKNKTVRGINTTKNFYTALKLGLSGFHGIMTTGIAITNQSIVATKNLARGDIKNFGKELSKAPLAPVLSTLKGRQIQKAVYEGTGDPILQKTIEYGKEAGFRIKTPPHYTVKATRAFKQAWRDGNILGAGMRLPMLIIEGLQKPILEWYVPKLKLAGFHNGLHDWLQAHPDATEEQKTTYATKLWDTIDNGLGQLVYDNLFWERWMKDVGQLSTLSLGWNLGIVRETGGALVDAKDSIKKLFNKNQTDPIFVDRMLSVIISPIVVGALGALTNWILTGEPPEKVLDLYYPKTGVKNPDGTEQRVTIPSYMKDVFSVKESIRKHGLLGGVGEVASHKIAPIFSVVVDMIKNEDFYGVEITDPNAPVIQKIQDRLSYIFEGMTPISISSLQRVLKTDPNAPFYKKLMPFLGVSPAPSYVTRTKTQQKIYDSLSSRYKPKLSKQEYELKKWRRDFETKLRANKASQADLQKTIESGAFGENSKEMKASLKRTLKRAKTSPDVLAFKYLTAEEQEAIFKEMNLEEKQKFWEAVKKDLKPKLLQFVFSELINKKEGVKKK